MEEERKVVLEFSPSAYEKLKAIRDKLERLRNAETDGSEFEGNDSFGLLSYAASLLGEKQEIDHAETIRSALRLLNWYLTEIGERKSKILVQRDGRIQEVELSFE